MTIGRRLILDQLKTALESITTGGGYNMTVNNVFRHTRTWNEVDHTLKTAISIHPGAEEYKYRPGNVVKADFTIDLLCFPKYTSDNEDSKINTINDLLDDIWVAIFTDTTLNSNAIETKIISAQTDEPDAEGQETLRVTLNVWYDRTTSRSV